MKAYTGYFILPLLVLAFSACNKEDGSDIYENAVFLDRTSLETVRELPISLLNTYSETITAAVPKKTDADISVTFSVDEEQVSEFNTKYGRSAVILPEGHYSFSATDVEIVAGNVFSPEITIEFTDVLSLSTDRTYVLPVVIKDASVPVIRKRAVKYYYFESASVINVVPDIDGKVDGQGNVVDYGNYFTVNWKNPSVIQNLKAFTFEAYAYVEFSTDGKPTYSNCPTRRNPDNIYSLMGCENGILVRRWGNIDNSKWKAPGGPFEIVRLKTSGDSREGIRVPDFPDRKWTAFTLTYDQATGMALVYFDQKLVHSERIGSCPVNIFPGDAEKENDLFHIGHSYNMVRWWPGCVAEVRIWNRALTAEEIADPIHPYFIDMTDAEASSGLVAYWKLNEGTGTTAKDCSGNGNDAMAAKTVNWKKVNLPEEKINF